MDSRTPAQEQAPTTPVLKGRKAKKLAENPYWNGMGLFWIGIAFLFSASLMAFTFDKSNFSKVFVLVGLAMALYGLGIELVVLVVRIIRER